MYAVQATQPSAGAQSWMSHFETHYRRYTDLQCHRRCRPHIDVFQTYTGNTVCGKIDTLGIEPRASRMLSGCDTTTPRALEMQCEAKSFLVPAQDETSNVVWVARALCFPRVLCACYMLSQQHQWSSGRIHRCHRCDLGSIPG